MLSNLLIGIGIASIPTVIGILLPRKKTYGLGVKIGTLFSKLLREKVGKRVENRIEKTLIDFSEGLYQGLRSDNVIQSMKKDGFGKSAIKEQKKVEKEIVKVKSRSLI